MDGIKDILWFIHRTVFELVPALVLDIFIYFFLIDLDIAKNLGWFSLLLKYIKEDENSVFKAVLICGIVLLTSLFVKALSGQLVWVSPKIKENLEIYPSYSSLKDKINEELKTEIGPGYEFNPSEIQSFIRYKIMEEHKEFNTFLWYISTESHAIKYLITSTLIATLFICPLLMLQDVFILWQYLLAVISASLPFVFLPYLLKKKMDEINRLEKDLFTADNPAIRNGKSKFRLSKVDLLLLIPIVCGIIFNLASKWLSNLHPKI